MYLYNEVELVLPPVIYSGSSKTVKDHGRESVPVNQKRVKTDDFDVRKNTAARRVWVANAISRFGSIRR